MRLEAINPSGVAAPVGAYSHAVQIPPGARVLHVSGQVGLRTDGSLAECIEAQSECAWRNIVEILRTAGMAVEDLVKITSLLTRREDFPAYAAVRGRFLGGARPASTSYVVSALVRPEWLVEVEAVAAKV